MLAGQSIASFLATCAFGVIYNIPRKPLAQGGLIGLIGWLIYFILMTWRGNEITATMAASFIIAVLSQIFARIYKNPVIVYSVSGIIPLVPGGLTYTVMSRAVIDQYDAAFHLAVKAFVLSGAIAMGLIFAEVIYQVIYPVISRNHCRRPRNVGNPSDR
ncbi:threonine/serine exporter [Sporolactobacillus sp. THM7-4]|nr:threonine/serine exporter [Sporolactobacillus sp. THM7-4]